MKISLEILKSRLTEEDFRYIGDVEDRPDFELEHILYGYDHDGGLHEDMLYNKRMMKKFQNLVKDCNMYEFEVYKNNPQGQRNARTRRKEYQDAVKTWAKRFMKSKNQFNFVHKLWESKR